MGAARLIHGKQLEKMLCVYVPFKQIFFMSNTIQQPQRVTPLSCKPEVLFKWLVLEDSRWAQEEAQKALDIYSL